tara:strand:+ start:405 stop:713 length:309 start_codon:yes stop_codon:yes gene_type:complete
MNKEELQWDLYKEASEYAERVVKEILLGFKDPTYTISGDTKSVYEDLNLFNWFEDMPVDENDSFYVKFISMNRYKHLIWKKKQPVGDKKESLSRWEKVMGAL